MKCKIKYPRPLGLQLLLGEKRCFSCFVCHYLAFFLCVRNKCGLEIHNTQVQGWLKVVQVWNNCKLTSGGSPEGWCWLSSLHSTWSAVCAEAIPALTQSQEHKFPVVSEYLEGMCVCSPCVASMECRGSYCLSLWSSIIDIKSQITWQRLHKLLMPASCLARYAFFCVVLAVPQSSLNIAYLQG